MPIYEFTLVRQEWSYCIVTVNAPTEEQARKRAVRLVQSDNPRLRDGEDSGDWCDTRLGCIVVKDDSPPIPQAVRRHANEIATSCWPGRTGGRPRIRADIRDAYLAGWCDAQDLDTRDNPGQVHPDELTMARSQLVETLDAGRRPRRPIDGSCSHGRKPCSFCDT